MLALICTHVAQLYASITHSFWLIPTHFESKVEAEEKTFGQDGMVTGVRGVCIANNRHYRSGENVSVRLLQ